MATIVALTGLTEDSHGQKGSAGAGKDTVADFLVKSHQGVRVGLADPMKRFAKEIYGFTDEQLWGPTEARNAPDFRYPIPGDAAEAARIAYDAACGLADEEGMAKWGPLGWLTPRHSLQILGTEWGRDCFSHTWILPVMKVALELSNPGFTYTAQEGLTLDEGPGLDPPKYVAISDVRFPATLDYLKEHSESCITVRVKRQVHVLSGNASEHRSELALLNVPDSKFDLVLHNYGTLDDLSALVREKFSQP